MQKKKMKWESNTYEYKQEIKTIQKYKRKDKNNTCKYNSEIKTIRGNAKKK